MTDERSLLHAVLDHNPAVRKALAAVAPDLDAVDGWFALQEALGAEVPRLVAGFLGNKSERLVLACLLMKADFAGQAVELSPDFWRAWSGLDVRNKAFVLDMLEEDMPG